MSFESLISGIHMSIGEWEPTRSIVIDLQKLKQYVGYAEQLDLEKLAEELPAEIVKAGTPLMKRRSSSMTAATLPPPGNGILASGLW